MVTAISHLSPNDSRHTETRDNCKPLSRMDFSNEVSAPMWLTVQSAFLLAYRNFIERVGKFHDGVMVQD